MAENVTAIYNSLTQQVCMIVVDCANLADPAFNPPDCVQIVLDVDTYNSLDPDQVMPWIASIVESLGA